MDVVSILKIIVLFTLIQRVSELVLSKKNEKFIIQEGGFIVPEKNYFFMVILHTSWILSIVYYVFIESTSAASIQFYFFLAIFAAGQIFRISAIMTLGKRWSTRIAILPKAPVIKRGLFNFIKHPNYLGVVLEIAALPLMANLISLAIIFSILNFIILYFRIKKEEQCLTHYNNYSQVFKVL
jgi:methyltransferase